MRASYICNIALVPSARSGARTFATPDFLELEPLLRVGRCDRTAAAGAASAQERTGRLQHLQHRNHHGLLLDSPRSRAWTSCCVVFRVSRSRAARAANPECTAGFTAQAVGGRAGFACGSGRIHAMAMVAPVARMLKSLGFPRITKLCLIACSAARVGKSSKHNKKSVAQLNAQNATENCFVYELCKELHSVGFEPMIAGWDGHIEVSTPMETGGKQIGGKFSQDEPDKLNKRVIQFQGQKPTWLALSEGWSDKHL
jgi:hypothetical protein